MGVLDEDDFVPLIVVQKLVNARLDDGKAESARSQSFCFSHPKMLAGFVGGVGNRGVAEIVELKPFTGIGNPTENGVLAPKNCHAHPFA